jgi:hypothetical protein
VDSLILKHKGDTLFHIRLSHNKDTLFINNGYYVGGGGGIIDTTILTTLWHFNHYATWTDNGNNKQTSKRDTVQVEFLKLPNDGLSAIDFDNYDSTTIYSDRSGNLVLSTDMYNGNYFNLSRPAPGYSGFRIAAQNKMSPITEEISGNSNFDNPFIDLSIVSKGENTSDLRFDSTGMCFYFSTPGIHRMNLMKDTLPCDTIFSKHLKLEDLSGSGTSLGLDSHNNVIKTSVGDYDSIWTEDLTLGHHWLYLRRFNDSVGIGLSQPTAKLDVNGEIKATVNSGDAINATSITGIGVYANAPDNVGVWGASYNGSGVYGSSTNSYGVYGNSYASDGVKGISITGFAGEFIGLTKMDSVIITHVKLRTGLDTIMVINHDSLYKQLLPTIPAGQIQSDWNQTNNVYLDFIKNKPNLSIYRTLGNHDSLSQLKEKSYNDLTDKPSFVSGTGPQNYLPVWLSGGISLGTSIISTTGTDITSISTYKGLHSDGFNIFMGGGGQNSIGQVGSTYLGSNNTAYGNQSFMNNTNGYMNVAIGKTSLYSNTTGIGNVAIGGQSLFNNSTGNYNIAIGYGSMMPSNGDNNTAIGKSTLMTNTTGSHNTAIGFFSMEGNETGFYNTAIGENSLGEVLYGWGNTGLGSYSLWLNFNGSDNIGIGDSAGFNETSSFNLYIGKGDSTTAPIYGKMSKNRYRINGNLLVKTIPIAGSRPNYVLSPDANNNIQKYSFPSYSAGYGLGLSGTTFYNSRYWGTQDSLKTSLSGLVLATAGKLTAITNNSSNWDSGYAYRLTGATGSAPLTLGLSGNALTGSIDTSTAKTGLANLYQLGLKANKATTITINGTGYDLSTNRSWSIAGSDTSLLKHKNDTVNTKTGFTTLYQNGLKANKSTILTINGTAYDISANRSWTIATTDTSLLKHKNDSINAKTGFTTLYQNSLKQNKITTSADTSKFAWHDLTMHKIYYSNIQATPFTWSSDYGAWQSSNPFIFTNPVTLFNGLTVHGTQTWDATYAASSFDSIIGLTSGTVGRMKWYLPFYVKDSNTQGNPITLKYGYTHYQPIGSYGTGSVTNITMGYGLSSTQSPLTTTGTMKVDSTVLVSTVRLGHLTSYPTLNQSTTGSAGSVTNALSNGYGINSLTYNGSSALSIVVDTSHIWSSVRAGHLTAYPTLNQNTTGTANVAGGTVGAVPYQSAANTTGVVAATATAGLPLISGANAIPTWATSPPLYKSTIRELFPPTFVDTSALISTGKVLIGYSGNITIDTLIYVLNRRAGTPSITPTIKYGTDWTASGTSVVTAPGAVTSYSTPTKVSGGTLNNITISAGNLIWMTWTETVAPKELYVIILGHYN